MTRRDIELSNGGTLVLYEDAGEFYIRFLTRSDEQMKVFRVPPLIVTREALEALCMPGFQRLALPGLSIEFDDKEVIVNLGSALGGWGVRRKVTTAIRALLSL